MKKIIAMLCAVVLITMTFAGCKDNVYYDKSGNPHEAYTKFGKLYQDEYGRLIERYKDENGKKVDYPFAFPAVLKTGKNTFENAFIKLKVPKDWYFDEKSTNIFVVKHTDCKDEAECSLNVYIDDDEEAETIFAKKSEAEKNAQGILVGENSITDYKEFKTKFFGLDAQAFKSRHFDKYTFYYYFMDYGHGTLSFMFNISDKCFDGKFDPEQFISENITLKELPTK